MSAISARTTPPSRSQSQALTHAAPCGLEATHVRGNCGTDLRDTPGRFVLSEASRPANEGLWDGCAGKSLDHFRA